ncbi:AraC family transcriptional regulator [Sinimarinibacterium sp. CAU 1509]|uniref:AraC family transcriptional regulator n=1 Tax=Sinimarinibacterium sp. CAU 1509 TaxID=2562283 RepID=UPI0010AC9F77|nr:AraC family transcriptional regulator [Sinimarinibacterium sp. CAU 1509]TJY61009.1 AraC family transcriptional regulator [Sinimarinibacterium sp. CAU 1509]
MSEHRIPIIYSRIIASAVGRKAAELRPALPGGLSSGADGYMSGAQYEALLRAACAVSADPLIALKAGANIPFSVHGPLGIAAMSSATLGDALSVIGRYAALRSPFCAMQAVEDSDTVIFLFQMDTSLHDQTDAALDFILSTIGCSISSLIAEPLATFRLELRRRKPAQAREYTRILGCDVVFGAARNAFVISKDSLATPLLGANPEEFDKALERLRSMHLPQGRLPLLRERVINVFANRSGHLCALPECARSLGMSTRTLQRKLRAEGLSFETLRDTWLSEQALDLLLREHLSVEVTATLLGYSEIANFRRSFRRWHGVAPAAYRARQAKTRARTRR